MSMIGIIASQFFSPTKIDDLSLWLDANDPSSIIESAGAVSQWSDKSGTGNHLTQLTGSMQPTTGVNSLNDRNVIFFNGANDFMDLASFSATPDITIIFVTKIILSNNTADSIMNMNAVNSFQIGASISGGFRAEMATANLGSTVFVEAPSSIEGIPSLLNYRLSNNDSNVVLRLDGVQVAADTYNGALSPTPILSLGRNRVGNHRVEADIAEVIIYNRDLTLSEMVTVEIYLMNKWGV